MPGCQPLNSQTPQTQPPDTPRLPRPMPNLLHVRARRFLRFLQREAVRAGRLAVCARPGCGEGLQVEGGTGPKLECHKCRCEHLYGGLCCCVCTGLVTYAGGAGGSLRLRTCAFRPAFFLWSQGPGRLRCKWEVGAPGTWDARARGRGRGGGAARDGFEIAFNGIGMPVLSRHAVPARSLVQCRACACEWHEGETCEERGSRLAKEAEEDAVFMAMRRWGAWCMVHGTGHCITVSASGNGTLAAGCLQLLC